MQQFLPVTISAFRRLAVLTSLTNNARRIIRIQYFFSLPPLTHPTGVPVFLQKPFDGSVCHAFLCLSTMSKQPPHYLLCVTNHYVSSILDYQITS